jgi:DNA repair protein RAD16
MQEMEIGGKAIVFSQFVNMLDLLEYRITLGRIKCVKLLGSMSIDQRDKVRCMLID